MPFSNLETLKTYAALTPYVTGFRDAKFDLVILTGCPGTAKTSIVREALGDDVCWLSGSVSAFYLYVSLYAHRDRLVVMDDVDGLYGNRDAIRLMKALAQTERVKRVHWHTGARQLDEFGVPRTFETSSRLLIVTNHWKGVNADVAALEDRGIVLEFAPRRLRCTSELPLGFGTRRCSILSLSSSI